MRIKARLLLVAHASLFFGAVLSGAILSDSLASSSMMDRFYDFLDADGNEIDLPRDGDEIDSRQ